METFLLVYRVVMALLAVGIVAMVVATIWMLMVAHRRGRLSQALAGGFSALGASLGERASRARVPYGLPTAMPNAAPLEPSINPATGLPMVGGIDTGGNPNGYGPDD